MKTVEHIRDQHGEAPRLATHTRQHLQAMRPTVVKHAIACRIFHPDIPNLQAIGEWRGDCDENHLEGGYPQAKLMRVYWAPVLLKRVLLEHRRDRSRNAR